jgi:hypothetical protein
MWKHDHTFYDRYETFWNILCLEIKHAKIKWNTTVHFFVSVILVDDIGVFLVEKCQNIFICCTLLSLDKWCLTLWRTCFILLNFPILCVWQRNTYITLERGKNVGEMKRQIDYQNLSLHINIQLGLLPKILTLSQNKNIESDFLRRMICFNFLKE